MITATQRERVIGETTELGIALLIAESEDGTYQPVATVSTIREGREFATSDMRSRMQELERGADPMCPARYLIWARNRSGEYATVTVIEAV